MEFDKYRDTVQSKLMNHDYERLDGDTDTSPFDLVYTKNVTMSNLDAGRERRFVAIRQYEDISIGDVNDAVERLREIGEENVKVSDLTVGSGGLASTPVFPVLVTDEVSDDDVREHVQDRDYVSGANLSVPVLVELEQGGGIRGPDVKVSNAVPKRRNIGRRRAVKKVVSELFEP